MVEAEANGVEIEVKDVESYVEVFAYVVVVKLVYKALIMVIVVEVAAAFEAHIVAGLSCPGLPSPHRSTGRTQSPEKVQNPHYLLSLC